MIAGQTKISGAVLADNQNRDMLDLLPFPVLAITADASFVWLNHAAETFLDSSRTMLVSSNLNVFFAPDSPIFSLIDRSLSSGRSVSMRLCHLQPQSRRQTRRYPSGTSYRRRWRCYRADYHHS